MKEENKNKLTAIGITVIISGLLTYWGIQGIGVYGMALFILTPLFIGMCPVIIYGRKQSVTLKQPGTGYVQNRHEKNTPTNIHSNLILSQWTNKDNYR
jgi:hypothetical protein